MNTFAAAKPELPLAVGRVNFAGMAGKEEDAPKRLFE
jgi:hypothetical protein